MSMTDIEIMLDVAVHGVLNDSKPGDTYISLSEKAKKSFIKHYGKKAWEEWQYDVYEEVDDYCKQFGLPYDKPKPPMRSFSYGPLGYMPRRRNNPSSPVIVDPETGNLHDRDGFLANIGPRARYSPVDPEDLVEIDVPDELASGLQAMTDYEMNNAIADISRWYLLNFVDGEGELAAYEIEWD